MPAQAGGFLLLSSGRSSTQDEEEPHADEHWLSPCVTSPLLELDEDSDAATSVESKRGRRWPLLLVGLVLVGVALWTMKAHIGEAVLWLAGLAENAGAWGIAATVLVLAVWVMLLMPISVFEVLIGHVFPLKTAMAIAITGKTLGAIGCFVVSQQAKPFVERLMRRHRRLRALERTVHAHPLKATLLVRFSMLPAPVKNYGWGSLGVDFWIFLTATLLEAPMYALPPVLLGAQLSDLADVAAGRQRIRPHPFQLGLGVAMLVLLVLLCFYSQRWLEQELPSHGSSTDLHAQEHADEAESELVLTPVRDKRKESPAIRAV